MTFDELLTQVRELLQSKGRVSYGALKLQFNLDADYLEGLKDELIEAEHVAADEGGKVLVWRGKGKKGKWGNGKKGIGEMEKGNTEVASGQLPVTSPSQPVAPQTSDSGLRTPNSPSSQTLDSRLDTAERRQLTVMFCDVVGSTALSTQLDPEELRAVIRAYRATCATVIRRFGGHLAKYIGDGLLVYFGYPQAHEDDAQRAVRAGLGIITALQERNPLRLVVPSPPVEQASSLPARLHAAGTAAPQVAQASGLHAAGTAAPQVAQASGLPAAEGGKELRSLQVRIGIHTGLVVAGEMGIEEQPEPLAIVGETPNIAARLQGLAEPSTVVISATTYHLIQGYFTCTDLGEREVKGIPTPVQVYQALGESGTQSRLEVAASRGLTPLVGREQEVGLLLQCWEQVKEGTGQVILLSGEAGIGKSRLVRVLRERLGGETQTWLECRCSPYHQNSAFYPLIDLLQRVLQFGRDDSPEEKLNKLEEALRRYSFVLQEMVPLFASLLSITLPAERYTLPVLTPQRQKEKTLQALLTWLLAKAEKQPVPFIIEDPHWADPSTLEFLGLLIEQVPTARLLTLLAFRPDFTPPWTPRSHFTHLTLQRLPHQQVEAMVEKLTGDKALTAEVVQQIVAKTDGVPLFVEELTKMVVESSVGATHASPVPLGIPATLQDALMARLDRLGDAKEIAQLGATLGREFSYEVLHAVSPLDEAALQQGLRQLVEAELLYQRGLPPQATYLFKHALIQDEAYQSLLKSTRQQYHRQIVQVLEERFAEVKETHPELLAHHYTEAGLIAQALPYWQKAGQRAVERSANIEAISHLTKGLELLKTLPDTPERAQQELTLQIALDQSLIATKGYAAPEVERANTRALELCRQLGETPQLCPVLIRLSSFRVVRAELQTARELAEQCLRLAQSVHSPTLLMWAHYILGVPLFCLGEFALAQDHLEQGIALYERQKDNPLVSGVVQDPKVSCLCCTVWALWHLGYPDQALERMYEALALARELAHPFSLAFVLEFAGVLHQFRREQQAAQERAEALMTLSSEQGFALRLAEGTIVRGWALAEQGKEERGIEQIRQGLTAYRATEQEAGRPYYLALVAEAYGKVGQVQEGLTVLAEALAAVDKTGERWCEAELYRLKGQLVLQFGVRSPKSKQVSGKSRPVKASPKSPAPNTQHPTPRRRWSKR